MYCVTLCNHQVLEYQRPATSSGKSVTEAVSTGEDCNRENSQYRGETWKSEKNSDKMYRALYRALYIRVYRNDHRRVCDNVRSND